MTTACPCFGRNENCRLCGGSGLVTSEVEVKVARSQHAVQTSYYSGQSDAQRAIDAARKEAEAAPRKRQVSEIEAEKRLEAAALDAMTPAGKLALKLRQEQGAKVAAERHARDAEQAARSIAYWNKRFPQK